MPDNRCDRCEKTPELCLCDTIRPVNHRMRVLILQHPQEPREPLSSARIAHLMLKNSVLRVGLSWPNLSKALGGPAVPSEWGVLYLGAKSPSGSPRSQQDELLILDRKGKAPSVEAEQTRKKLKGIVLLDGSWSQAKTLWWRNPWLLKLHRLVLKPAKPARYSRLRREPRRECLSTIESVGKALVLLGESEAIEKSLLSLLDQLILKVQPSPTDQAERREPRNS